MYLLEKDVPIVMGVLDYFFPPSEDVLIEYKKGLPIDAVKPSEVNFCIYTNICYLFQTKIIVF